MHFLATERSIKSTRTLIILTPIQLQGRMGYQFTRNVKTPLILPELVPGWENYGVLNHRDDSIALGAVITYLGVAIHW